MKYDTYYVRTPRTYVPTQTELVVFDFFSEIERPCVHFVPGDRRGWRRRRLRQGLHLHLQEHDEGQHFRPGRMLRRLPRTKKLQDCQVRRTSRALKPSQHY